MEAFVSLSILFLASLMEKKHVMLESHKSKQGNKQIAPTSAEAVFVGEVEKRDGHLTRLIILENIQAFPDARLHSHQLIMLES